MLRRFLDFQLSFIEKKKRLSRIRPLISALDAFCYEAPINTKHAPFIRDSIDLKRWMFVVVFALFPAIFMAIWNTGLQKMVYGSGSYALLKEYLTASESFSGYFNFVLKDHHYLTILKYGAGAFLPVMIISYLVGGLTEGVVACLRGHEIAEGFLVTGMLYPLILPPTIPYWMVALGIIFGVIIGKELFGGTGMNILNPALTARAFLFFTFPGKMTGDVWVGTNPTQISTSLKEINQSSLAHQVDGFSQATPLGTLNAATYEIKRIHVDAIASNALGDKIPTYNVLETHLQKWNASTNHTAQLGNLSLDEMQNFVTSHSQGGLGLSPENFSTASQLADTTYGIGHFSDGNLFFGNMLGSMGETSTLACIIGALILIYTGIASWRTMVSFGIFAFLFAYIFEFSSHLGEEQGAWNAARYAIPAYRHLLMGGLAFGLVYMATDPVSSPSLNKSKWIYGAIIGTVTILIRLINPAYPEGVMLAILFGNVFAPLIDYHVVRNFRRRVSARKITQQA